MEHHTDGKTILITGGNSGIGLETAIVLARMVARPSRVALDDAVAARIWAVSTEMVRGVGTP